MVNLNDVFMSLKQGVQSGNARYRIVDDHHVYDTETELKYHFYSDKPFEVSMEGEVIISGGHMTNTEAEILSAVKKLVKQAYVNSQRKLVHEIWLGRVNLNDDDDISGLNGGLG